MIDDIIKKLLDFNDSNFVFDPKYHKYTYLGKPLTSVTKYIERFETPFDEEYWSDKKSKDLGVPKNELLKEWKEGNDYANEVGSQTHKWIEDYFNKIWNPIPLNLDVVNRINKFNKIYSQYLYKLSPIKFETKVFSKRWNIAGTIDGLFYYNGKVFILDYKTNKKFTTDDDKSYKNMLYPFSHLKTNKLNLYSIQISLYSLILKEWGCNVGGGYLIHIGPGDEEAKIHRCVNLMDILEKYLDENPI